MTRRLNHIQTGLGKPTTILNLTFIREDRETKNFLKIKFIFFSIIN